MRSNENIDPKSIEAIQEFITQNQFFSNSMKAFVNAFDQILKDVKFSKTEKAQLLAFLKPYRDVAENNFATRDFSNIQSPTMQNLPTVLDTIKKGFSNKENVDAIYASFEEGMQNRDQFDAFMKTMTTKYNKKFKPGNTLNDRLTKSGVALGVLKAQQVVNNEPVIHPKTGKPVSERTQFANETNKMFQQAMRVSMPIDEANKKLADNELTTIVKTLNAKVSDINERKRQMELAPSAQNQSQSTIIPDNKQTEKKTAMASADATSKMKRSSSMPSMSKIFKTLYPDKSSSQIKSVITPSAPKAPAESPKSVRKVSILEHESPKRTQSPNTSPSVERAATAKFNAKGSSEIKRKEGSRVTKEPDKAPEPHFTRMKK